MSAEEVTNSVEGIELEAEKTLEEARSRANEIILKARGEADRILSSEVRVDEVKKECEKIVDEAEKRANQEVEKSKKEASEIRTSAGKKMEKITQHIVNIITGAELR